MAGHSQFKNIMHRKGAQDKKRSKMFTKLIREIVVAAKSGLPDPASNPRLRSAIQAARVENMPKDKIDAAIKKASGEAGGDNYDEVRYEGYGPGGVAIIVEALTDNRNRTAADVRAAFTKMGGNMGESGSVGFMFERVGRIEYPAPVASEETMLDAAIEAGADNVDSGPESHVITCAMESLHEVSAALEKAVGEPRSSKFAWLTKVGAPIDEEQARSLMKLIDLLEDNDDVQEVTVNAEIAGDVLERLSA